MSARRKIKAAIHAENTANAFLQNALLEKLTAKEQDIKEELGNLLGQGRNGPLPPTEKDVAIAERLNEMRGLIKGRLLRPTLRHIYLLLDPDLTDNDLELLADRAGDRDTMALKYHFRVENGPQIPQAFARAFLAAAMKGDISRTGADNILMLFVRLGFASRCPCIRGQASMALKFDNDFIELIESWMLKKDVIEMPKKRTTKRAKVAAASLAAILFVSAVTLLGGHSLGGMSSGTPDTFADAQSEADMWKGIGKVPTA